ncbi:MAG TPA: glutamate-5-semialdehyde dehydrogenase [Gemmataceae bacterium]|nr:glutamate-5-semialdehyde dehydrogenase [Gemmataceae bacterium]
MPTAVPDCDLLAYCEDLGRRARAAARSLAAATGEQKNAWLLRAAEALETAPDAILQANAEDLEAAPRHGLSSAQVDRLRLTPARLRAAATGLREIAVLPDPVGRILDSNVRPNGLQVHKVGVPLGVILFLYESRPNVTVDAAGLCVKSGNAVILRGGKEAFHSNLALHRLLQDCLVEPGLPSDAVQLVATPDRAAVGHLVQMNQSIDLVIPRGGEGLIRRVAEEARMPVLKHFKGVCHVYVDAAADLAMAERIVLNAKCQRPGVCNAAESLLVHRAVADEFLPKAAVALRERGVELRGCPVTRQLVPDAVLATEEDYATEYLDLILSVKVVDSLEQAVDHVARYGSQHTETIVTNDLTAARRFTATVDSAAVMVNTSTRFHDGYEFGLGAEIGISTDKLHARGPCGLVELCSYKYVVWGDGQVRGE